MKWRVVEHISLTGDDRIYVMNDDDKSPQLRVVGLLPSRKEILEFAEQIVRRLNATEI